MLSLPDEAAAALESLRRTGKDVRFEIKKACEQERWRLKALYDVVDEDGAPPRTIHLGLLWSDDRQGVRDLKDRLERGESGRAP
ncbi:hypothetical protein [Anaeromyxobacter terrae]|uniref:hypothetical protein n=1 Tax=Anaeromyxobacter terrae TaxID=2925406 RepID=UPI001F576C82|nr:hypothetical protein [Anaeromyxobacter sp. SG22]